MENNQPAQQDPPETTTTNPFKAKGAEDGSEREKPVGDGEKEKEEEEAFLVSLYKFMKDRHTPIERIPHLGFKQINLWKIYKAVEKLGAYELVTGRRLWKNVYDELGGSPGSTSAATCTRRHYERLVLPYVRHLKGEEDKPLPPSKPRRQYKSAKDEKGRRGRKERGREQMAPDKAKAEVAPGGEDSGDPPEPGRLAQGPPPRCPSPAVPAPSPPGRCPSPCRAHSETYKRLFSSFYSKGNHPIMSPLAKKKLLAQVSEAESLRCHKRHCPEGRWAPSDATPGQRSPEPSGAQDTAPSAGTEAGASPGGTDPQGCPRAEGPPPAVFTGYFHACRSEGLPGAPHPLWGYFSSFKDFLEPEQPQDLRGKAWEGRGAAVQAWVPPGAGHGPRQEEEEEDEEEDEEEEEEEEEPFGPRLGAVSPILRAAESRDRGRSPPRCHRGLPKPRAVVATPGFSALHFPAGFGSPLEPQGVPAAPALSGSPFLIPAFPSPLVVGPAQPPQLPPGSAPRHRPYPWHSPRPLGAHPMPGAHPVPGAHRHARL